MARMAVIAATFDCFGTLVDWDKGIREFFRRRDAAAEKVAEWEAHQRGLIQGAYRPYRDIMRESLHAVMPSLSSQDLESFPDSLLTWPVFSDVSELSRAGVKLGILSNMDTDLLEGTLRRLPVKFDFFVSAEQVRSYKPRPEHFRRAIDLLRCRPEQIVHCAFGVFYDIRPAKSLGLKTVLVRRTKIADTGSPDASIDSLSELPALLKRF